MPVDLVDRVRRRLASAGGPTDVSASVVAGAVRDEAGGVVGHADVLTALTLLRQEFVGAGPLDPLLRDPTTTDILVTAPDQVWVDNTAGLRRTTIRFADEDTVRRLAQRLAMSAGRRLDDALPYVDGWLPAASGGHVRLHAVLPPISDHTCLSLRVLRPASHGLADLHALGTFPEEIHHLLTAIVHARLAFLVTGGTGSGKTTLLSALLGEVPHHERVIGVEDVAELQPAHPQYIRLTTRSPNIEGAGEVSPETLVRQALRMRPDRIVVGELRGAEVAPLLTALNTGHDGGAGTVHANSPTELPARLEALGALAQLTPGALHSQLAAAIHLVLHLHRTPTRTLTHIGLLSRTPTGVSVVPLWANGTWTSHRPALTALLRARGVAHP
ncbi:TadA family conjugal transfer-associated ATPase [Actinokineospora auranticolor]|uniref:Pilus assembly protein CpaF n=1 Tax=Actinokineospora auranticolor TaxID=155976 RepID=A0A2S6GKS1_9PSEU|nr:TadA family conjugal transfer-associated ATPase [Actinokineospora auranticolor]PPK65790.1 pilus assembly protein CpaF [Actinokineospora auranticolor]